MKVIIVGGVAGGAGAAARLRRIDESAQIVLLERGEHISYANCGLPYYVGGVITEQKELLLQTPRRFGKQFGVDVRVLHECLSVDVSSKTVQVKNLGTGEVYSEKYDKLILSPGARPIVPPIDGAENAFTLRTIPDADAIINHIEEFKPKSCAVIGAGFIGLEMAENLIHRGIDVSIIEAASHVIGPLDTDMAYDIHKYINTKGIRLLTDAMATKIEDGKVMLADGRGVDADMVLMSVGVLPDTSFLRDSGIELGKRGEIIVNEYLETSQADVYAVGDAIAVRSVVTGESKIIPLASPANKQARLVADNVSGKARKYMGAQGTAIIKFFDLVVAMTGENEASLAAGGVPYMKSVTHSESNAGYYPGGQMMTIKILFDSESGRLLGSQIVGGKGVDKRIDIIATALRANMTIFDLQDIEFAYAPPFSSAKDPVNMAGYVAENILRKESQPIYVEELDMQADDVLFLDVRTPKEFEKGAIAGSVNVPLGELRDRVEELDKARNIVVVCQIGQRGYNAERLLRQQGFNARNLAGGYRMYMEHKREQGM